MFTSVRNEYHLQLWTCGHALTALSTVFDNPGRQLSSPKMFERKQRDNLANLASDHRHVKFDDIITSSGWRNYLGCRVDVGAFVLFVYVLNKA